MVLFPGAGGFFLAGTIRPAAYGIAATASLLLMTYALRPAAVRAGAVGHRNATREGEETERP